METVSTGNELANGNANGDARTGPVEASAGAANKIVRRQRSSWAVRGRSALHPKSRAHCRGPGRQGWIQNSPACRGIGETSGTLPAAGGGVQAWDCCHLDRHAQEASAWSASGQPQDPANNPGSRRSRSESFPIPGGVVPLARHSGLVDGEAGSVDRFVQPCPLGPAGETRGDPGHLHR